MRITSPATRMEMARAMGVRNPVLISDFYNQLDISDSWALYTNQKEFIGVGGVCRPDPERPMQVWLLLSEAARKHMLTVIRAIRLTLAAAPYDHLECQAHTQAGGRIAAMCGLTLDRIENNTEIWTCHSSSCPSETNQPPA